MSNYDVIRRPIITEKSVQLMEQENKYIFEVQFEATKPMIKRAIEDIFEVRVTSVNTLIVKGKRKMRRTRRGLVEGRTSDWKKAVVTLAEGDKIEIFEGV